MKKLLSLFIACFFLMSGVQAQEGSSSYQSAIGLHLADQWGLTYKMGFQGSESTYLDFIGTFQSEKDLYTSFGLIALYELHKNIGKVDGLRWYVGAGPNVGFTSFDADIDSQIYFGITPVAGLDYKFKKLPINVSLDYKPNLSLYAGEFDVDFFWKPVDELINLSVRYTLK